MPNISTRFKPTAPDFGAEFVTFSSGSVSSLTANTTTTFGLGGLNDKDDTSLSHAHQGYIDDILVGQHTLVADADGTVLFNLFKYDASADSAVQLVTSFDLEAQTAKKVDRVPFDSGVTDAQRVMESGDFLYWTVVNNSAAISTQPTGLTVTVLVKLLK